MAIKIIDAEDTEFVVNSIILDETLTYTEDEPGKVEIKPATEGA